MSLEKNPTTGLVVEIFDPTLEFLTLPDDTQNDFCVLKGTIPPGHSVPLHSHPDTEDFLLLSGALEGLKHNGAGYTWIGMDVGEYIHVPAGAKHAWRNLSNEPVINFSKSQNLKECPKIGVRASARTPIFGTIQAISRFTEFDLYDEKAGAVLPGGRKAGDGYSSTRDTRGIGALRIDQHPIWSLECHAGRE